MSLSATLAASLAPTNGTGGIITTRDPNPPPLAEHPTGGLCRHCSIPLTRPWYSYQLDPSEPWTHIPLDECPQCEAREIEIRRASLAAASDNPKNRAQMALEAAIAAWDEQTPAEFREPLQIDRLPTNPQIIQAALSWRPSQTPTHSLLLAGPSRSGKTRILYALARSLVANNISVTLIPMDRFALWARLHSSEGSKSEADWITHLATVNVLILDDLGKGRLTPTAEDALFASIRERHAHRRPTLISTQENRSTLASKFHDQASAVAIIERILETSTQLRFGNKPTQANQQSLETTNQQPKKN